MSEGEAVCLNHHGAIKSRAEDKNKSRAGRRMNEFNWIIHIEIDSFIDVIELLTLIRVAVVCGEAKEEATTEPDDVTKNQSKAPGNAYRWGSMWNGNL